MFTGVTAHHKLPAVTSHEEALAALEASYDVKLGKVVSVRHTGTGIVAFRLYDTDVVTWHPDNSFEIRNHGTVTTGEFARRFTPRGAVSLSHPVTKHGVEMGHRSIMFNGKPDGNGWWWREAMMCGGKVVRFRQRWAGDGSWVPDEDTLDVMQFPEFDQREMREIGKRFHLRDFEMWLSTAPHHFLTPIAHEEWDVEECAIALEERDFVHVARFMPLIIEPRGFGTADRLKPLPIKTSHWTECVTMGCVGKLKLALWEREGAVTLSEHKTLSLADFNRRMVRVRQLGALGIDVEHMGPHR